MIINWNGTFLGKLTKDDIEDIGVYNEKQYLRLKTDNGNIPCQVKSIKNAIPCILDEIKPLFKLFKHGTHYANLDHKFVMLIRVSYNDDEIFLHTPLGEYSDVISDVFKSQIQNILIFREIMGIHSNLIDDVDVILNSEFKNYPISCVSLNLGNPKKINTQTENKWIKPDNKLIILCRIFNVKNIEDFDFTTLRFRIEKIIMRIDKNFIYLTNDIIDKLFHIIQQL